MSSKYRSYYEASMLSKVERKNEIDETTIVLCSKYIGVISASRIIDEDIMKDILFNFFLT